MDRLDRRLHLPRSGSVLDGGTSEVVVAPFDRLDRPGRGRLPAQRDEAPGGISSGHTPRLGVPQQRGEAVGLGVGGEELAEQVDEPKGFGHQADPPVAVGGEVVPSGSVGGVDGVGDRCRSSGKILRSGHPERNAGHLDLPLGPDELLAECGGGHQEGGGDARRVEAEDRLQHEGRVQQRWERRVRTGEEELEALVRDRWSSAALLALGDLHRQVDLVAFGGRSAAARADEGPAGDGEHPALGLGGHPAVWPCPHCGLHRVGKGVLGGGDVGRL